MLAADCVGVLKTFNKQKCFGFIAPVLSELPQEVAARCGQGLWFFPSVADVDDADVVIGSKVLFDLCVTRTGKLQACKLRPVAAVGLSAASAAESPDSGGADHTDGCHAGLEGQNHVALPENEAPAAGAVHSPVPEAHACQVGGDKEALSGDVSKRSRSKQEPKDAEFTIERDPCYNKCFACKNFLKSGFCQLGDACPDAHSLTEVQPLPDTKVIRAIVSEHMQKAMAAPVRWAAPNLLVPMPGDRKRRR